MREIVAGRFKGIGGDAYYGYEKTCRPRLEPPFARFGLAVNEHEVRLIEGLFQDTIRPDGPVALAHIDGDWYDSVGYASANLAQAYCRRGGCHR